MTDTIRIENVSKRFGAVEAAKDVSFHLREGETVALVGHNGAGKTTLLKLMLGLIHPTSGRIEVLGDDPAVGQFAGRRRLGYLPENVSFNAALTGTETMRFYARLKREGTDTIAPLLDRVGLTHAAGRRVGTYSKGMRQRLGLAQALLGAPRVLLLDEPTTGLDPALRQSFYQIVEELRAGGATVLLSSHALTELEERAGRVIILNRGLKVADGTIEDLRRLARLPIRIRIALPDNGPLDLESWLGPTEPWRRINGHVIEVETGSERKMEVLRRAITGTPVEDVEIIQPTLDDLYAHFLRSQDMAL